MTLDELRQRVLGAFPNNWLDPLLTGEHAVVRDPLTFKQVELLVTNIAKRVEVVLDQARLEGIQPDTSHTAQCICAACEDKRARMTL